MLKKIMLIALFLAPVVIEASEVTEGSFKDLQAVRDAAREVEGVLLARGIKVIGYDENGRPIVQRVSSPRPTLQHTLQAAEARLHLLIALGRSATI